MMKSNGKGIRLADLKRLMQGRVPPQLVIQITERCNATCPQCGMRAGNAYTRSDLSLDQVKGILDAAATKGVRAVSFTGGEPFLRLKDLAAMINHAVQAGIPYVRTGTNGYLFARPESPGHDDKIRQVVNALAQTKLRNLWISLDSFVPAVHDQLRGFSGLIEGLEKALPIFHEHGIYPSANLGINRYIAGFPQDEQAHEDICDETSDLDKMYWNFLNTFSRFLAFAIKVGFSMVSVCYPMSIDPACGDGLNPVYGASSDEDLVRFTDQEKAVIYRALMDVIPLFRSRIRIFTPRSALYALYRQHSGAESGSRHPCRGGTDFFFIDAAGGNTYPCGYRGNENLGPFAALDLDTRKRTATCASCDWECFRDPSEFFGPFLNGLSSPVGLWRNIRNDPTFYQLWYEDLRYAYACNFFDGRAK